MTDARIIELDIVTAAELADMIFPPVSYVVDGYIAEGLTILAGRPKAGKSWLALNFGTAVASGGMALGSVPVEAGDVLYLALEEETKARTRRQAMSDQNRFGSALTDQEKEKIDRAAWHEQVQFLKRQQWAVTTAGVVLFGAFFWMPRDVESKTGSRSLSDSRFAVAPAPVVRLRPAAAALVFHHYNPNPCLGQS